MKSERIVPDVLLASQGRPPECFVPKELNPVQRELAAALAWFGPNGEKWLHGPSACSSDNSAGCIWFALHEVRKSAASTNILYSATHELFPGMKPSGVNRLPTTTFATVRRIYERAIELAADAA